MVRHLYLHFTIFYDHIAQYHNDACDTPDTQQQQLDSYQAYHIPQSTNNYAATPDHCTYSTLKNLNHALALVSSITSSHQIRSTVDTYTTLLERLLTTPLFPTDESPPLIVHSYCLVRKFLRHANTFRKKSTLITSDLTTVSTHRPLT